MLSIMTTGFYDKDDDHDNKYPCLSSDHCRTCVNFSLFRAFCFGVQGV